MCPCCRTGHLGWHPEHRAGLQVTHHHCSLGSRQRKAWQQLWWVGTQWKSVWVSWGFNSWRRESPGLRDYSSEGWWNMLCWWLLPPEKDSEKELPTEKDGELEWNLERVKWHGERWMESCGCSAPGKLLSVQQERRARWSPRQAVLALPTSSICSSNLWAWFGLSRALSCCHCPGVWIEPTCLLQPPERAQTEPSPGLERQAWSSSVCRDPGSDAEPCSGGDRCLGKGHRSAGIGTGSARQRCQWHREGLLPVLGLMVLLILSW